MPIEQIATRNEDGSFENLFPLPIDKGGTGAATKEQALTNLGAMPLDKMKIKRYYHYWSSNEGNQLPNVYSNGITFKILGCYLEFFEVLGTNIRGINRFNLSGRMTAPASTVSDVSLKFLPVGSVPEKFRPTVGEEERVMMTFKRDTTGSSYTQAYTTPIELWFTKDGAVQTPSYERINKYLPEDMTFSFACGTQFFVNESEDFHETNI